MPPDSPADVTLGRVDNFARQATLALGQARASLEATAHPILLERRDEGDRSLGGTLLGLALAVSLAVACPLLAAGALALEREEQVLGRLRRGLAGPGALVGAKVAFSALAALALGAALAIALAVGLAVTGASGPSVARLPLLVAPLLAAGAALGAAGALVGALAPDLRTAVLAALACALPLALLALVPSEVAPAASAIGELFPVAPAAQAFGDALFDPSPAGPLTAGVAQLLAIGAALGVAARAAVARLER